MRALLAEPSVWTEPPSHLEDAVVAAVVGEAAARPAAGSALDRPRRGRALRTGALFGGPRPRQPWCWPSCSDPGASTSGTDLDASLEATDVAAGAEGYATFTETDSGWRIELNATGLPRLDGGRFYQAWLRDAAGPSSPWARSTSPTTSCCGPACRRSSSRPSPSPASSPTTTRGRRESVCSRARSHPAATDPFPDRPRAGSRAVGGSGRGTAGSVAGGLQSRRAVGRLMRAEEGELHPTGRLEAEALRSPHGVSTAGATCSAPAASAGAPCPCCRRRRRRAAPSPTLADRPRSSRRTAPGRRRTARGSLDPPTAARHARAWSSGRATLRGRARRDTAPPRHRRSSTVSRPAAP